LTVRFEQIYQSVAEKVRKKAIELMFLAKRYCVMVRAVRLSSVRLSSVMLLHSRQRLELFGNIFAPPNSSGLGQFV